MSLSDIFNFILDIFKFIWNLDLIWFAIAFGLMLVIALVVFVFNVITEALESFYENNPKYAFYIRWVIAIAILLLFLVAIIGAAISPSLIEGTITIDQIWEKLF